MKTPREIVDSLERCGRKHGYCKGCAYRKTNSPDGCIGKMHEDAAKLIQDMEITFGMYGGEVGITDVYEERARLEEENRALRTELATNHIGDVNKKGPDQEAKADAGKPCLTLVPPRIIWEIAKVREFGTAKYHDPENWRTVEPDRLWAACTRHIVAAWNDYRATDADSGLLHLAHAATNLAFLLQMIGEEDHTDG